MSKFDHVALAILSAAAVLAGTAHAARIEDRLRSVQDGGIKLSGSVGCKLDRLIAHRVSGVFARNVIFPSAKVSDNRLYTADFTGAVRCYA